VQVVTPHYTVVTGGWTEDFSVAGARTSAR